MYRCVIIELKLCRTHALFNCDEACLERKDPTYRASVDAEGEQIDAETVKDVLNFVDATTDEGTEMAEVQVQAPQAANPMPVRDRITNKKQLNKQKMAINVLGALNTEINTIWKFGIKKFRMFLLPLFQK